MSIDGLNTDKDMAYFTKCETTVFETQTRDIQVISQNTRPTKYLT